MIYVDDLRGILIFLFVVGLCLFGVYSCNTSAWYAAVSKANDAATLARETPHIIRQADGCKVYAFESGGTTHFFTRCGETVTTERHYTERVGKISHDRTEVIETHGNK